MTQLSVPTFQPVTQQAVDAALVVDGEAAT